MKKKKKKTRKSLNQRMKDDEVVVTDLCSRAYSALSILTS